MSPAKPKEQPREGAIATQAQQPPAALSQIALGEGGVELRTAGDLLAFCQRIAGTEIVPPDVRGKPDACFAKASLGMALGFDALTSIRRVEMWSGKPTLPAELQLAAIRNKAKGVLEHLELGYEGTPYQDDFHAWIETRRRGFKTVRSTFSVADAKQADLWGKKDNWRKYPKAMLKWRAVGIHGREAWSDVLNGVPPSEDYDREDFRGPERARNVTPQVLRLDVDEEPEGEGDPLLEPEIVAAGEGAGAEQPCSSAGPDPEVPGVPEPAADPAPVQGELGEWSSTPQNDAAHAEQMKLEHEAKLAELKQGITDHAQATDQTRVGVTRLLAEAAGVAQGTIPTLAEAIKMLEALERIRKEG